MVCVLDIVHARGIEDSKVCEMCLSEKTRARVFFRFVYIFILSFVHMPRSAETGETRESVQSQRCQQSYIESVSLCVRGRQIVD